MKRIDTSSILFAIVATLVGGPVLAESVKDGLPETVSYYEHVRPVLQAKCSGCHQPARAQADYVITDVARLIKGGESDAAVVPGKPDESFLVEAITKAVGDDRPYMPPKGDVLTPREVSLVKKWIEQGAADDTPENVRQRYDQNHPPQYAVPPVITSLDYSPDGSLLAIAGFHEVLLRSADGNKLVARLIGLSERIETVRFSPNGKRLVVAGGLPGRMGEIQVWDVAKRKLLLSKAVGYDTAYGASWSPDGKHVAFGLPDNTVRAIDAKTGEQTLFMGSHNDWVLDTGWSPKGDHLVSVGRDMSAKLTNVETERFIDNITSITPGALRGGVNAVAPHPTQDHLLVGGSDGVPQIFRMHRETVRKIGDNANLIRKYPEMKGRIWSVAFADDGEKFVACSSLNGKGQVNVYHSVYDATISKELKKLFETVRRSPDGKNSDPKIEEFHTRNAKLLHSVDLDAPAFSVAFAPDGNTVAAGAANGEIHLIDVKSGDVLSSFAPIEIASAASLANAAPQHVENPANYKTRKQHDSRDRVAKGRSVIAIEVWPSDIALTAPNAYRQLLVTATYNTGETADFSRLVKYSLDEDVANIAEGGIIRPQADGWASLTAEYEGLTATAKVGVSGMDSEFHPDFIRDVNPVISRLGCNAGTCHGAKDGKNGFKLSLRGYDALYDVRAFGDDHAARRVNFASPDDSLMLLKATGAVPHEGGQVTEIGSTYYNTIRQWIAAGAVVNLKATRVTGIEVFPQRPVIQNIGANQQIVVIAHYEDGSSRDVTREAYIESGNTEVAVHDDSGLMMTLRRGEAPVLARYGSSYAAATLTVMGDRDEFVWSEPETWNEIDQLVASKWERMKILPSGLANDNVFLRRVYLDLTGLPPQPKELHEFLADSRPTREKRAAIIDRLIGSPEFVDHWTNKWADMLQVNSKFLGREGATLFREWIREHVAENTPYDKFVFSILTAKGSNKDNPAASYFKILRTPEQLAENTTHLFLATRFNCNKCHDHPFEKWNVDNYYQTAAFFAELNLQRDKKNAPKQNIGGSAVETARPLYEVISDGGKNEVTNIVTGQVAKPTFPYEAVQLVSLETKEPSRREKLAAWITAPDNQYFARSYANRVWAYMTGTGLIEPIDDIRAGNPPTNPELLQYLEHRFIESGFDVRDLMREICNSRTYQLSIETNRFNEDDSINYSHAKARRLPAEVLFDSVMTVTGSTPNIPGAKGMRAAQLADAKLDTKSGLLANLGRPPRESACECERQSDIELSAVMTLLNSPSIGEAVNDPDNAIAKLVKAESDDKALIEKIYTRVLNRKPTSQEIAMVVANWSRIEADHDELLSQLADSEAGWVRRRAALEHKRLVGVAKAKSELDSYMPEYNKSRAAAKKAREDKIAKAQKELQDFTAQTLPEKQKEWLAALKIDRFWTTWHPRKPTAAVSVVKTIKLAVKDDASVLASGGTKANTDYNLTIPVKSATVSGIMLEALTDDALPNFGPGINRDGNFVVSEVVVSANIGKEKNKRIKLVDAVADHNQNNFDVKRAINGSVERSDRAWAVAGQTQRPHWARFKLDKPIEFDAKGGQLIVQIRCRYSNGTYPLGKFRIWTTDSADPLLLGLPVNVAKALSTPPAHRSEDANKTIAMWFRDQQPNYQAKRFQLFQARQPIGADKKLEELKAAVAKAERPVNDDPNIVRLRSDVEYSIKQSVDRRLTAAQDLTWALINNAAFLFNH